MGVHYFCGSDFCGSHPRPSLWPRFLWPQFLWSRPPSDAKFFFRLRRYGRRIFRPNFFVRGVWGGRSRSFHFKKFAKANFLKWCRGGVWGGLPPQESPLPVPCPQGGSGGLRPLRNLRYPCLAPAATMPCPRALPPIYAYDHNFFRNFFV